MDLKFIDGKYINPDHVTCVIPEMTNSGLKTVVYINGADIKFVLDYDLDEVVRILTQYE